MVLSNNHLGGLSGVTSYQSQSACFSFPPFFLFILSVCRSRSVSPRLRGSAASAQRSPAAHVGAAGPPSPDAITD